MPRLVALLLPALLLAGSPGAAAQPGEVESGGLRVALLTAGPGDAVWERFGHSALRITDPSRGLDVAFNWGIFDFRQEDFVPRFLRGAMLYSMAPFDPARMVEGYLRADRDVTEQVLDLDPRAAAELLAFAEWNALPENRDYRYDYFLDNCSTRIRDLLDHALGGALSDRWRDAPSPLTFRGSIRRLTANDPWLFAGMDLLLGSPGDRAITVWEEMFVPMVLRDALRETVRVDASGARRPAVLEERVLGRSGRTPEPSTPPDRTIPFLLIGLAGGGLLALLGRIGSLPSGAPARSGGARAARLAFVLAGSLWSLLAGIVGVLLLLVLATDHGFMAWNRNLLLFSPLSLGVALGLPRLRRPDALPGAVLRWSSTAAAALAALALVALPLPVAQQDMGIFLAAAIPVHLGLLSGIRTPDFRPLRVAGVSDGTI